MNLRRIQGTIRHDARGSLASSENLSILMYCTAHASNVTNYRELIRMWKTAPKKRLPNPVLRAKLVTGGADQGV